MSKRVFVYFIESYFQWDCYLPLTQNPLEPPPPTLQGTSYPPKANKVLALKKVLDNLFSAFFVLIANSLSHNKLNARSLLR